MKKEGTGRKIRRVIDIVVQAIGKLNSGQMRNTRHTKSVVARTQDTEYSGAMVVILARKGDCRSSQVDDRQVSVVIVVVLFNVTNVDA